MDASLYSNENITLANPYQRLVHRKTRQVADFANGALSRSTSYANSVMSLTKDTAMNGYPVDFAPYKEWLIAGKYDVLLYNNASPADTDPVLDRGIMEWTGSEVVGGVIRR